MKLTWFGSATDCEFDLTAAIARHSEIEMTLYVLSDPMDQHDNYHFSMLTTAPNITIHRISGQQLHLCCDQVSEEHNDLIIMRHPVWIFSNEKAAEIAEVLKGQPLVIWTWEWLPNLFMRQMPDLVPWKRLAVTNFQDYGRSIRNFPDKQTLYFPFGVIDRTKEELIYEDKYASDLVCDAQPHYECNEYKGIKHQSVDQMVIPVLDLPYKLSLWGSRYGNTTQCDWGSTTEFKPFHRGNFSTLEYPKVYASSKIYLGVSWNWHDGGFSIRFARALGCGIMMIWHRTLGCEKDIPDKILEWSDSPEQTKDLVQYYMEHEEERNNLGRLGKEWGVKHCEWGTQLKRLANQVK